MTDGTEPGTRMVVDWAPGKADSALNALTEFMGQVVYSYGAIGNPLLA